MSMDPDGQDLTSVAILLAFDNAAIPKSLSDNMEILSNTAADSGSFVIIQTCTLGVVVLLTISVIPLSYVVSQLDEHVPLASNDDSFTTLVG
jgi:hypothetical protein